MAFTGRDYRRLVVVSEEVPQVVVELGVLKFFQRQFVLHLENGVLGHSYPVAFRVCLKESSQFFDCLDRHRLVKLWVGRIKVIAIASVEPCEFRILSSGIALVVGLEIQACVEVILVFKMRHGEGDTEPLRRSVRRAGGDYVCKDSSGIDVFLFVECAFSVIKTIIGIAAFQHLVVFPTRTEQSQCRYDI